MSSITRSEQAPQRLVRNCAAGRPPHLVPIWFVLKATAGTSVPTQTASKPQFEGKSSRDAALEDGDHPFWSKGQARSIDVTTSLPEVQGQVRLGHNVRRPVQQLIEVTVPGAYWAGSPGWEFGVWLDSWTSSSRPQLRKDSSV